MHVIGVVGKNGSGKDELVEYLAQRCDAETFSVGDIVRQIAEERGVPRTRENLHEISQELMDRKGKHYFIQQIIEQVKSSQAEVVGITGIRTPDDEELLRQQFKDDFTLVYVQVGDAKLRFQRIKARDDPRDPQTFEAFVQQDREEEQLFSISETVSRADVTIPNDRSLEDFHQAVDSRLIRAVMDTSCE